MLNKNTLCEEVWRGGGGTGVFCSLNLEVMEKKKAQRHRYC